ncbi:uncharacterized protein LOC142233759 [Haematobia irritans]|uniref:uncharacterized protein LOC142233759 n=1 Tax=Haematobia irritans TaxID=7368 RepID=UPI003F50304F
MDVRRLIREIHKRPALWGGKYKFKDRKQKEAQQSWQEVADALGAKNVMQCKRKWKNLRDSYRRHLYRCKKYGSNKGKHGPKAKYFADMEFLREHHRRLDKILDNFEIENGHNVKKDPLVIGDYDDDFDDDDDDDNDDIYAESNDGKDIDSMDEFQDEQKLTLTDVTSRGGNLSPKPLEIAKVKSEFKANSSFVIEENPLAIPKRKEPFTKDPDTNFLMSFEPYMKQMNSLQNLQFRSGLSELLLKILTPTLVMPRDSSPK